MTNIEKYKTPQERAEAFEKFCEMQHICTECPLEECHELNMNECRFAWLNLECEEEKPLPCQFCGSECKTFELLLEKEHYVVCDRCRYTSAKASTEHEAIAAHNRVAKKCMEVK